MKGRERERGAWRAIPLTTVIIGLIVLRAGNKTWTDSSDGSPPRRPTPTLLRLARRAAPLLSFACSHIWVFSTRPATAISAGLIGVFISLGPIRSEYDELSARAPPFV